MKQEKEVLHSYLEQVGSYLKSLPEPERVDIVKEIQSEMAELATQAGMLPEEIVARLGNPKELAMAYLGDSIGKSGSFRLKKLPAVFAFYSLAGFGSLFVLPFISVLSVGLMAGGILGAVAGAVKSLGALFGIEVPWIVMQFGSYQLPALFSFPAAAVIGLLLVLAGRGLWKLTIRYIQMLGRKKRKLAEE